MPHQTSPLPNWSDFRLSISRALQDQLVTEFARLTPAPLTQAAIAALAAVPAAKGVYRLHYPSPQVVYVGKAVDLADRLAQHLRKLGGRSEIDLADVGFTCLSVEEDLATVAPENVMIDWQRGQPGGSAWNGSGFGARDPGRRRDNQEPSPFDRQFPIDLSVVPSLRSGTASVAEVLRLLRGGGGALAALPYDVRAQRDPVAVRADYETATMRIASGMTADEIFAGMVAALNAVTPPGTEEWQATALFGRVVLYRERPARSELKHYPFKIKQW